MSSKPIVTAAVVQAGSILFDTARTLNKLADLASDASARGTDLAVFPEAFVGGYPKGLDFGARIGSRTSAGRDDFLRYHAGAADAHDFACRHAPCGHPVPGRGASRLTPGAIRMPERPPPRWALRRQDWSPLHALPVASSNHRWAALPDDCAALWRCHFRRAAAQAMWLAMKVEMKKYEWS
ncbi:nitrilase-related carbon-nitrogen hydrolase [Methylobacterium sp. NEAU K]|uniref:nitrilase-related carbon-nitrogen hydrolase n=1 Tax=Methylobacterium sp. NEAU K TaxID=3064946 RepID=UPI0027336814|nr:nitrilase-related carbon-nitrogen hydrolase [Methylobacterium sp. NEAU K]MDP4006601.1 nitrilase-related carbon-nitrogen hydrolase [Methylobacterium sp. NEAU K]